MNSKKIVSAVKLELKNINATYITGGCLAIIGLWTLIQCLTGLSSNYYIDTANYLYIFAVLTPILIPAYCLKRMLYLNVSKDTFFKGTLFIYIIAAVAFSVLNLLIYSLTDLIFGYCLSIKNLSVIFSWRGNGVTICLFQQFAFFILVECFFHTLTCANFHRSGIVADILIAAVLAVFIPIASLRKYLTAFFDLIIFNDNWAVQLISCLILSAVFYLMSVIIIKRRKF